MHGIGRVSSLCIHPGATVAGGQWKWVARKSENSLSRLPGRCQLAAPKRYRRRRPTRLHRWTVNASVIQVQTSRVSTRYQHDVCDIDVMCLRYPEPGLTPNTSSGLVSISGYNLVIGNISTHRRLLYRHDGIILVRKNILERMRQSQSPNMEIEIALDPYQFSSLTLKVETRRSTHHSMVEK